MNQLEKTDDNKGGNTELLGILLFLFIQFNDNWTGNTVQLYRVLVSEVCAKQVYVNRSMEIFLNALPNSTTHRAVIFDSDNAKQAFTSLVTVIFSKYSYWGIKDDRGYITWKQLFRNNVC